MSKVSGNDAMKRLVGVHAADLIKDGMKVGIGTGSTVGFLIEELGRRVGQGLQIHAAATSYQTRLLCKENGIPLLDCMLLDHLDIAIDGADEIDPSLNAIKGGGAAHTLEKVIASMSDVFILIADETKLVSQLCTNFPLPVEVIPAALSLAEKRIRELGGKPRIRKAIRKDGPIISENGNFILDITFHTAPEDLELLDIQLKKIPGLLETGLFLGLAQKALIGSKQSVQVLLPKG